jgi:hypothetical protein
MADLLRSLGRQPFMADFYLGGGTAVALRLGHRRSIDLDFFSAVNEVLSPTREIITTALLPWSAQVVEAADGNLLLRLPELYVAFLSYGYPLLEPARSVEGVAVADLLDLGLMKLDALIGRGSRKDFYDVYAIAQHLPLHALLNRGSDKYPYARDFSLLAVESLVQFDHADTDHQPQLLLDAPWSTVRAFFEDQARALGQSWFSGGEPA